MCVCVYLCAAGVATMRHDLIIAKPGISVPSAACVSVCVCGLCVYMCTCVGVCVCVYLCAASVATMRHDLIIAESQVFPFCRGYCAT